MSRWLEKQEKLLSQNTDLVGVPSVESRVSFTKTKYRPGQYHIWKRGDSLFDIAQEMRVPLEQLKAFNEIESYTELEDGIKIYYPEPVHSSEPQIVVELFGGKIPMHINNPGGAKKWAFGSMKTWDDARPSGFYPENTNLDIYAVARFPVEDKNDPEAEAAYYLDYPSIADYDKTGRLRYTIGYACNDVSEGYYDPTATPEAAEQEEAPQEQPEPAQVPVVQPKPPKILEGLDEWFVAKRMEDFKRDGSIHKFTETYQKLEPYARCIANISDDTAEVQIDPASGKRFIWIRDFALKRPNRRLFHNQEVNIAATFEYDNELYGRPVESIGRNFFGLPMAALQSQDEVYNDDVDASTRQKAGLRVTWSERYLWIPVNRWLQKHAPGYMKKIQTDRNRKG